MAGRDALAAVERLRATGRGWPIVVGKDEHLVLIAEDFSNPYNDRRSPAEILEAAAGLVHPRDLLAFRAERTRQSEEQLAKMRAEGLIREDQPAREGDDYILNVLRDFPGGITVKEPSEVPVAHVSDEPEIGAWPVEPPWLPGLGVAEDYEGKPLAKAHILLIPTDEAASVPAYLRWGVMYSGSPPEYQVAALRSWHQRYGAELVGLGADTMNLRVTRRPTTRDEALALAREHFDYCPDIVWQGTGTLAPLAASLMVVFLVGLSEFACVTKITSRQRPNPLSRRAHLPSEGACHATLPGRQLLSR